jgi:hypothetical protein
MPSNGVATLIASSPVFPNPPPNIRWVENTSKIPNGVKISVSITPFSA